LDAAKKIAHSWRFLLAKSACCRCIILNAATPASVLEIYAAAVKFSLEEHQAAFDAAVVTYRARNQDVPEKAARRVVERIIRNNL